jgi:hypothetical protein
MNEWTERMKQLLYEADNDRIVNCDETAWKIMLNGLLMWTHVGTDFVAVEARLNEKDATTVLASVTAPLKKLPLCLIAKRFTSRVEATQLGPHQGHPADHSTSGWTTTATFLT